MSKQRKGRNKTERNREIAGRKKEAPTPTESRRRREGGRTNQLFSIDAPGVGWQIKSNHYLLCLFGEAQR